MITRLLAALLALYIVAGAPKPGDLPAIGLLSGPSAPDASQSVLAKQALDFCLAHRETCANMAAGLVSNPVRTGAIAEPTRAPEAQQPLPQPAPELPLPPRRRG
jgi:hypothetical protein